MDNEMILTDDLRRVPREELDRRLEQLRRALTQEDPGWQLAVVTEKTSMYYYTGTMQEGAYLVRPQDAVLWVRRSLRRAWNESLLPASQIRPMHSFRQAAVYYDDEPPERIYLDEKHTSLEWLGLFGKYFQTERWQPLNKLLTRLRSVKSPYELALMERSGRIHQQVLTQEVTGLVHTGISEAELAIQLYWKMVQQGSQGIARTNRPTGEDVVGLTSFGKSALVPTAFDGPGGTDGTCIAMQSIGSAFRFLKPGRLIYLDIPCGFDGYTTDKSVVYYYGDLAADPQGEEIRRAYAYCVALEQETASLLKPGAVLGEIYDQVMGHFDHRYDGIFMNGGKFLGHSVGLCLDETPVIAGGVRDRAEENMTFALEPKIALPGIGMVGTENTYRITSKGALCLTGGPQELVIIPAKGSSPESEKMIK